MVHVTYREQLEVYADRLHEEFDRRDAAEAESKRLREALRKARPILQYFAAKTPQSCFGMGEPDPAGTHAALEAVDAALNQPAKEGE